jgi:hypothetical protein
MDMSTLSPEDAEDFTKRLAVYGMDAETISQSELKVPPNSVVRLAMSSDTFIPPRVMRARNFDELKAWIGVPDTAFDGAPIRPERLPRPFRTMRRASAAEDSERGRASVSSRRQTETSAIMVKDLRGTDLDTVRHAAKAYIRGDSRLVSHYRPIIERFYEEILVPVWAFLNIHVASGAVLEFGPGANVLIAHSITVEEGGEIRSQGHLNVSATLLKKQLPYWEPVTKKGLKKLARAAAKEG